MGPTVGSQGDGLAVQDRRLERQALHRGDHLGDGRGHVAQVPGVDGDSISVAMDLDPGAVELVLGGSGRDLGHGGGGIGGGLGQHRLYRPEQGEAELGQRLGTAFSGGNRDRGEFPADHGGAADLGGGDVRGDGDGLDHDALERTLAQFPQDQPPQERLLGLGRLCQQAFKCLMARRVGSFPGDRRDIGEGGVDLAQGERWIEGGLDPDGIDGGVAKSDATLGNLPGQVGDPDPGLDGIHGGEKFGEGGGLCLARPRRAHTF